MKSKSILKDKKFISKCKDFFKKHKSGILDIILFGSSIRGKINYNDIDVLILFKDKISLDISQEFKSLFSKLPISVTSKTYSSMLKSSFFAREEILSDGYSLIYDVNVSKMYGYRSYHMFRYSLNGSSNTTRVKFYYALYGRGKNKGMIEDVKGIKFSQTIVLVPTSNADIFKQFLKTNNITFEETPVLIPERVVI